MARPVKNLRHALKSLVPNWLGDLRGLNVGFAVLFVIALIGDLLIEVMFQGLFASWPGKGTPTALGLLGRSRGLVRGIGETDAAYSERLRGWLDLWPEAGSDETLGRLIQAYLGNNLVVRVVDRRGRFTTINADGSVTKVTDAAWNFDTTELPDRAGWWSDLWIIVYLDSRWPVYTSLADAAFIAAWGSETGFRTGLQVPQSVVSDINAIMAVFKGAHSWIEALVFTTDTSLFVPGSLGVTYPDGRWGAYSREIATVQSAARPITSAGGIIRYWDPGQGG